MIQVRALPKADRRKRYVGARVIDAVRHRIGSGETVEQIVDRPIFLHDDDDVLDRILQGARERNRRCKGRRDRRAAATASAGTSGEDQCEQNREYTACHGDPQENVTEHTRFLSEL